MNFSPGWTDYLLLAVFAGLFVLSGGFTFLLAWGSGGATDARQNRESHRPLCLLEAALGSVLCGLAVTSGVLLLTAQAGMFRIRFWLLLLAAYDAAVFLILWKRLRLSLPRLPSVADLKWFAELRRAGSGPRSIRLDWSDGLALLLALLTFVVLNRPAEFVATHRDPGEYLNIAVKLSESGSLRFQDADYQGFDAPEKEALFLQTPLKQAPFPEILPGFYLANPSRGELLPQFFPLYSLWLSLGFKLWRFGGAFLLNTLLGTLGVLLLIPLAQRILDSRIIGLGAAVLLASTPAQIWLSRSPFSEMLAQVFLLGGLWLLAAGLIEKRRNCEFLAACLFGLCLFVRIDSALILLALVLLLPFRMVDRKAFFLPLAACSGYAAAHTAVFSFPYLWNVLETLRGPWFSSSWFLLSAGFLLVGLLFLIARLRTRTWSGAQSIPFHPAPDRQCEGASQPFTLAAEHEFLSRFAWAGLTLLLALAFIYGLLIRPHMDWAREVIPLPAPHVGTVPLYNEINWVRLTWYLTPLALPLVFLGALECLRRVKRFSAAAVPFLLVLTLFAGFYLYKSRVFPDNYWVIRRYIEIVIPGFLMLAGCGLCWIGSLTTRFVPRRLSMALSALLFLVVWAGEIRAIAPLWKERELAGTLRQMEILASLNERAGILLLEQGPFQDFFLTPLKVIFQKTVYPLASLQPDVAALEKLVEEWLAQGKRIHLLTSEEQTELPSQKLHFVPQGRLEFKTQIVEPVYERLPRSLMRLNYSVQIYDVRLGQHTTAPESITLGMDFNLGYYAKGFHLAETNSERETFRWTSGLASLELPPFASQRDAILTIRLAQDFPEKLRPSPAKIFFNGNQIAGRQFSSEFETLHSDIPKAWLNSQQRNRVVFESNTYSPVQLGNSEDQRELGLMIDGLKLQSAEPVSESNPLSLDLGGEADALAATLAGFFGREPASYRWTGPQAEVRLPVAIAPKKALRLSVRAVKSCPDPAFRQWLSVSLDGVLAGKVELVGTGTEFKVYEFMLLGRSVYPRRSLIQLSVTPPWNPSHAGSSADSRTLGCAVDWIEIAAP